MILTVVAFKFSIANTIPVLPYTTLMDKYIDYTIISLFLFGVVIACYGFYFQWYEFPVDRGNRYFSWLNVGPFGSNLMGCMIYFGIYIIGSLSWFYHGSSNLKQDLKEQQKKMLDHKKEMKSSQGLTEGQEKENNQDSSEGQKSGQTGLKVLVFETDTIPIKDYVLQSFDHFWQITRIQ